MLFRTLQSLPRATAAPHWPSSVPAAAMLLVLMSIAAGPLRATPLACEPASRPVLEILAFVSPTQSPQLPPVPDGREALQLCQDHRQLVALLRSDPEGDLPTSAILTQGRVKTSAWSEFSKATAALRIGFLQSCRLNIPTLLRKAEIHITWHGAGTRRNRFLLSSTDDSLAPCSQETNDWWQGLFALDLEPGAESVNIS